MNFPPVMILASAGTGKTYKLSNRFLKLLFSGENPERILATTFTRKAAAEIHERVFTRLARASLSEEGAATLASELDDENVSRSRSVALLDTLLRAQHRLSICTLDSLFVKIGTIFAGELGLSLSWSLLDASEEALLHQEALAETLRAPGEDELLALIRIMLKRELGQSLQAKLDRELPPLYALFKESPAGAWYWELEQGSANARFEECLRVLESVELPKTQKGEVDRRFTNALQTISNYIRQRSYDKFHGQGLIKAVADGAGQYQRKELSEALQSKLLELIQLAVQQERSEILQGTVASYRLLDHFSGCLEQEQDALAVLSFDDLKRALSKHLPARALDELYFRLDTTYHHLLLDEFQDTSLEQWQVLEPFAAEILSKSGEDFSFFCVGDPKQAIYGWRGGRAEILDRLGAHPAIGKPEELTVSYRSASQILDVVNQIFANLPKLEQEFEAPEAIREWCERFKPHEPANKQVEGYVEVVSTWDEEQEESRDPCEVAAGLVAGIAESKPEATIAALVRRNKSVREMIEWLGLIAPDLPVSEEGGNPLTDCPAVSLVLSLLHLIDHPSDTLSRYHVHVSPLEQLFDQKLQFLEQLKQFRESFALNGFGEVLFSWVELLVPFVSERDRMRLLQLVELAYLFQGGTPARMADFVRFVEETKVEDPLGARVRVMTVHQAKGLEFDAVVLPELDKEVVSVTQDSFFGLRRDPLGPPERIVRYVPKHLRAQFSDFNEIYLAHYSLRLRESISVLYVALTRAARALYLVLPAKKQTKSRTATPKLTFQRVIQNTLGLEDTQQRLLYVHGNPAWKGTSKVQRSREAELDVSAGAFTAGTCLPRVIRASDTEQPRAVNVASIFEAGSIEARNVGILSHKFLEGIEWLRDGSEVVERIAEFIETYPEASLYKDWLVDAISREQVRDIFSRERYGEAEVQLYRELPYSFLIDEQMCVGTIDRLVVCSRGAQPVRAEVIDFKSDASVRPERYLAQLKYYRRAVTMLFGLADVDVSAFLLFLEQGECVTPAID